MIRLLSLAAAVLLTLTGVASAQCEEGPPPPPPAGKPVT
jgi:hypothetical protein